MMRAYIRTPKHEGIINLDQEMVLATIVTPNGIQKLECHMTTTEDLIPIATTIEEVQRLRSLPVVECAVPKECILHWFDESSGQLN